MCEDTAIGVGDGRGGYGWLCVADDKVVGLKGCYLFLDCASDVSFIIFEFSRGGPAFERVFGYPDYVPALAFPLFS